MIFGNKFDDNQSRRLTSKTKNLFQNAKNVTAINCIFFLN